MNQISRGRKKKIIGRLKSHNESLVDELTRSNATKCIEGGDSNRPDQARWSAQQLAETHTHTQKKGVFPVPATWSRRTRPSEGGGLILIRCLAYPSVLAPVSRSRCMCAAWHRHTRSRRAPACSPAGSVGWVSHSPPGHCKGKTVCCSHGTHAPPSQTGSYPHTSQQSPT